MRGRVLVPLALVALAALGAAWFLANFERAPVKYRTGPTGEARVNPFLAAERFAGRMGLRARAIRSLPALDALRPGALLLMPNRRESLDRPRIARLIAWVERGGHLVVEAEPLGVPDPLLDALGVARRRAEPLPGPAALPGPAGEKLRVSLPGSLGLPDARVRSFARGHGAVTVAASLHFARNRLIGEHDNARFLWTLLERAPARSLAVYHRPQRLSLWGFLAANAPAALAAAALLLALWLWRIAPRFGPVAPEPPPGRRRLLDHLRASGRYFWANNLRPRLVLAARDAALRRMARAQPDFADAAQGERVARLSSLIGISHEEASLFLAAGGEMRGAEFIRLAQHAQRIHAVLERGES